jgi:adenylate cyclase
VAGQNYFIGWLLFLSPDRNALDRASQLAQQSITLDESQPFAHSVLGTAYLFKRQYAEALTEAQRAIALDPNSAFGYQTLSYIMNNTRRPAEAIDLAEKVMRLDPRNHDRYLWLEGWSYTVMGRYEEAIPILKRYLASYSNMPGPQIYLVVDYIELGREPQARAEAAEILRINPNFSVEKFMSRNMVNQDETYRERVRTDLHKAGLK